MAISPSKSIATLFEDEWLIAVNKPSGLRSDEDLRPAISERIGREAVLFHRLDKETSGVILLGKRREANAGITSAFEKHKIRKSYLAVVEGEWRPEWNRVETFVARGTDGRMQNVTEEAPEAKRALTTFRRLAYAGDRSLLEAILKTGRTHQIRLHCLFKERLVMGDRLYGAKSLIEGAGQALHAYRLDFRHPITEDNIRIEAPVPAVWRSTWFEPLLASTESKSIVERYLG